MTTTEIVDLIGKVRTATQARRCCAALAAHYGATLRYGPDSTTVQVLAAALDALRIEDRGKFLANCAITVGDDVYLPLRVGNSRVWSYNEQVALVAHECQHVRQGGDAHLLFWLRYFTSQAHRATFETAALAAEMEVTWRLSGIMPDPRELADRLAWYRVGATDRRVAARHLAIVRDTLARGGEVCDQIRVIAEALGS
jgi:hypothetical protein